MFLGERGYESDTLFSKTGDGTTRWNALDYDKATAPMNWTPTQKYDTDSVVGYNGKVYVSLQADNLGKDPEIIIEE